MIDARCEIEVIVFVNSQPPVRLSFRGPIELGRQRTDAEELLAPLLSEGGHRLAFAPVSDGSISFVHVFVEPLNDGLRLHNRGTRSINLESPSGPPLPPGEAREVGRFQRFRLGEDYLIAVR